MKEKFEKFENIVNATVPVITGAIVLAKAISNLIETIEENTNIKNED